MTVRSASVHVWEIPRGAISFGGGFAFTDLPVLSKVMLSLMMVGTSMPVEHWGVATSIMEMEIHFCHWRKRD